jgi:hypothetical protein
MIVDEGNLNLNIEPSPSLSGQCRLRLPSSRNLSRDKHQSGSLRVRSSCSISYPSMSLSFLQSTLEPLTSFRSSGLNTNLSRSISFTWLHEERNEIPLLTDVDQAPILKTSQPSEVDGWAFFLSSSNPHTFLSKDSPRLVLDLSTESLFSCFLNNEQTSNH